MAACFYIFKRRLLRSLQALKIFFWADFPEKLPFFGQKGLYMFETLKIFLYQDS